jgi:hypothetical protein
MTGRYWRPGVRVFWRGPGVSQIAVDPRCAAVVDGLDPVAQALLERLPEVGTEADLNAFARTLGVGRTPVRTLLDRLDDAGYLLHERPLVDTADERYWQHAELAGTARPLARRAAHVRLEGLDQLGLRLARVLAQAGVGRLELVDSAVVEIDDLSGDGYRPTDVGLVRRDRALALVRASSPMTALSAAAGTRPDLVVMVQHGAVDPVRTRPLMRDDVPHVVVLVREIDVVVGPLVRPGLSPCLRCLDLVRSDEDPRWPAVATQLTTVPPSGTEATLSWLAAAMAAHQVLAHVDGRGVLVDGATLEISATYPLPRYREWAMHPECGCSAPALSGVGGERGREHANAAVVTGSDDAPDHDGGVRPRPA